LSLREGRETDPDAGGIHPRDFADPGDDLLSVFERDGQEYLLADRQVLAAFDKHPAAAGVLDHPAAAFAIAIDQGWDGAGLARMLAGLARNPGALPMGELGDELDAVPVVKGRVFKVLAPPDDGTVALIDPGPLHERGTDDPHENLGARNQVEIGFEVNAALAEIAHAGVVNDADLEVLDGDQGLVFQPGASSSFRILCFHQGR
jgi:hypothetical protein